MNPLEKAVAYALNIHLMGTTRKVDPRKVDLKDKINGTRPEEDSVSVEMKILKSPEYDSIKSLDRGIKSSLEKLALPSPFKDGIYLIPIPLIERVNKLVENYKAQREAAIEKFIVKYQEAIDDAKARLNGFFDSKYYPEAFVIRSRFSVDSMFVDFGTPTALDEVSPELFAKEQQAMRQRMQNAAEEIQLALRSSFQELVNHMVEILTPGPDGKYKKFYESSLTNLKEFLGDFSARNITDDTELDALVTKAKDILNGADVSLLRDAPAFKQAVATSLDEVKTTLATLVTTKGRKFAFEDEPAADAA